jgi:hypothetical protein
MTVDAPVEIHESATYLGKNKNASLRTTSRALSSWLTSSETGVTFEVCGVVTNTVLQDTELYLQK